MKKIALFLIVLLIAAGAAGYLALRRLDQPFRGYESPDQLVDIPTGASTRAIGDTLIAKGIIRDEMTYRLALWASGEARRLQAGEYRFDHPMTARDVLGKIARGDVDTVAITFPEGLTIAEMSKIFESHGFGKASAFLAAARDPSAVRAFDTEARDLEGYTFPDTYSVPRQTDAGGLVHLMVGRFEKVFTPELRQAAADRGLTVRQLVTLASIIEKETAQANERPEVAAVYANRLKIGMALQCDPTVIYALERAGKFDGNLRRDDLQFDSPYNTYRYPGLPPGPIAAPGKMSLEAAAHPAKADFLYFVSRNDGSHAFARTLDEHNRNVQQYQVQYFRARRAATAHR
jgi:UPF0755 protein